MVEKKGFMRIVEATVSVLIILAVLLIITFYTNAQKKQDVAKILPEILDEIAQNESLRENITDGSNNVPASLDQFVNERINNRAFNYTIKICELNDPCLIDSGSLEVDRDIFAAEKVISTSIAGEFNPRKIKIFIWRRT